MPESTLFVAWQEVYYSVGVLLSLPGFRECAGKDGRCRLSANRSSMRNKIDRIMLPGFLDMGDHVVQKGFRMSFLRNFRARSGWRSHSLKFGILIGPSENIFKGFRVQRI